MDNGQSEKHLVEELVLKINEIITELEKNSMELDNFDKMNALYRELDILSAQYARLTNHAIVERL